MRAMPGFSSSILPKIILGVLFLAFFSTVLVAPYNAQAQSNPTETPTPNPTIESLETQIAAQQVDIEELQYQQARKLDELSFEVTKQLYVVSGIAAAIVLVITFFGLRSYNDIDKHVKEKIEKSIEKEYKKQIEEADIALIPIRVQQNKLLDDVVKRLKLYGLQNLSSFTFYSEQLLRGITVVVVDDDESEKEFQNFIKEYEDKLNPQKAAFILYTGSYRVSPQTTGMYPNLTMANMPATVGLAVFNIGKTLRNTAKLES